MLSPRFQSNCQALSISEARLLLAVSGGRDSVVLEHLCHSAGFNYQIAHCNFHLRGDDSDRDEQFVRQLAQHHNRTIHVAQFDTRQYAADHHLSIEEAARHLRYDFFEQVRQQENIDYIVVAHHRDDSIETFFINLLRGTGIAGLHGIRPINGRIVRPLLIFSRADIDAYVSQHNLEYVEDSTNATLQYRRNQVRHQLLPFLRTLNPSFDDVMQQTISHLADVEQIYRTHLDQLQSRIIDKSNPEIHTINIDSLKGLTPLPTILFELLRPYGFSASQTADIINSLEHQSGSLFLSPTHRLLRDRRQLLISPISASSESTTISFATRLLPPPSDLADLRQMSNDTHAYFDADKIALPLRLRHWRDGDRFYPFGMKGSQLVSDYFSDHKFSLFDKQSQNLLVDANDQILWIIGHRTDQRASITASTQKMIEVTITAR